MRITFVNQFYTPDVSPTAHMSASLAEHRAGLGDEVTVVTSRGGYTSIFSASSDAGDRGPRVYRLWTPRLGKSTLLKRIVDYATFYLQAIWRLVRLPRQDVVVSLTTPPYIIVAALAHKLIHPRTKLVLWNMDAYPDVAERHGVLRPGGWFSAIARRINQKVFRQLDHLVCLDRAMENLLVSQYGQTGERTVPSRVIPNWERADLFSPDVAVEPWREAAALGLGGNFVVLYLGNTGFGHDFQTVLDAAQELRGEPVRFVFVGGGKRWDALARARARRRLDNVILRSYVPKETTPSVMRSADCALITLRDDALGVMSPSKLHSNLAMGLPILYVGPGGSNVDEAIRDFGCGFSYRHGQTAELVQAIRAMIADPEQRAALRARARHAFEQAYCDARTLPLFDELFEELQPGAGFGRKSLTDPAVTTAHVPGRSPSRSSPRKPALVD